MFEKTENKRKRGRGWPIKKTYETNETKWKISLLRTYRYTLVHNNNVYHHNVPILVGQFLSIRLRYAFYLDSGIGLHLVSTTTAWIQHNISFVSFLLELFQSFTTWTEKHISANGIRTRVMEVDFGASTPWFHRLIIHENMFSYVIGWTIWQLPSYVPTCVRMYASTYLPTYLWRMCDVIKWK